MNPLVLYDHFRAFERKPGESMGRPTNSKGAITVAWSAQGDTDGWLDRFRIGLAFTSPKDQFCRRTGRAIAYSRWKSNPLNVILQMSSRVDHHPLPPILRAFLTEEIVWARSEGEVPERRAFTDVIGAEILGPTLDNKMTLYGDARHEPKGLHGTPIIRMSDKYSTWFLRVPSWARDVMAEEP